MLAVRSFSCFPIMILFAEFIVGYDMMLYLYR